MTIKNSEGFFFLNKIFLLKIMTRNIFQNLNIFLNNECLTLNGSPGVYYYTVYYYVTFQIPVQYARIVW